MQWRKRYLPGWSPLVCAFRRGTSPSVSHQLNVRLCNSGCNNISLTGNELRTLLRRPVTELGAIAQARLQDACRATQSVHVEWFTKLYNEDTVIQRSSAEITACIRNEAGALDAGERKVEVEMCEKSFHTVNIFRLKEVLARKERLSNQELADRLFSLSGNVVYFPARSSSFADDRGCSSWC